MIALLLLAFAQPNMRQPDTLQTVLNAVKDNHPDSLELRYQCCDPETKATSPKWTWAFQGSQYVIAYDGGSQCFCSRQENKLWMGFDGTWGYNVGRDPTTKEMVKQMFKQRHFDGDYERNVALLSSFAWRLPADETFAELLESARVVGKEEIDGHSCWKVDLGTCTWKGKETNRMTAWFDPEVGYWHRKIEFRPFDFKPVRGYTFKEQQYYLDRRILEFAEVEDGETGKKRWFPKRCRSEPRGMKTMDIVIEDVRINHDIPIDRFIPDMTKLNATPP